MGTLSTVVSKVRLRIKENKVQFFTDTDLVSLINDQIGYAFDKMKNIECKAIITTTDLTLIAGTQSYALTDYFGLVSDRVFTKSGDFVPLFSEFNQDAFSYKPTTTGVDFFNHVGDEEVVVDSWQTKPELNVVDLATVDIPYGGYWDLAITRAVVVETQEVREHDNSRTSVFANEEADNALYAIFERYGIIPRRMRGTLSV